MLFKVHTQYIVFLRVVPPLLGSSNQLRIKTNFVQNVRIACLISEIIGFTINYTMDIICTNNLKISFFDIKTLFFKHNMICSNKKLIIQTSALSAQNN